MEDVFFLNGQIWRPVFIIGAIIRRQLLSRFSGGQDKIYELVHSVNNFQYEFLDNESEFDNLARECLIRDIEYILQWFHFPINVEEVLAQREWE